MKRIIVLVGPPGVGKSTLVVLAKQKGFYAVDIEDVHNEMTKTFDGEELRQEMTQRILFLLDQAPEGISIFGAGGYGGSFPQDLVERVLLLPNKEVARERFYRRDAADLDKKNQNQKFEEIYDYFLKRSQQGDGIYHRVITSALDVEHTLQTIVNQ